MKLKKMLLSGIGLAVLFGSVVPAEAQYYHHHHHRNCFYRHHHRICR